MPSHVPCLHDKELHKLWTRSGCCDRSPRRRDTGTHITDEFPNTEGHFPGCMPVPYTPTESAIINYPRRALLSHDSPTRKMFKSFLPRENGEEIVRVTGTGNTKQWSPCGFSGLGHPGLSIQLAEDLSRRISPAADRMDGGLIKLRETQRRFPTVT